jgi:magnesium chelatase subunit I
MAMDRPRTLGELRASGYRLESIKDEMRRNLIALLREGRPLFPEILGYEETVVPQVQNAILSRHDILFLGLRGQAKTRMLRQLVCLLDDAMPIVEGSEVNDHPYAPLSREARDKVAALGDATPVAWVGRPDRRDRHDQARRGTLPLQRADDALRPDPPHQPRDLLHQ